MATDIINPARLHALLHYEAATGVFTWLPRPESEFTCSRTCLSWNARDAGKSAGGIRYDGYLMIRADATLYLAHRLAWLYVNGEWPTGYIDHINGVRSDNRISNLRDVTNSVNAQNVRRARSSNMDSGMLGVSRVGGRWRARLVIDGMELALGCFSTPEEAHATYLTAKRIHHPGGMI